MKVGLDDVAAEAGETPSTSRRNDEPTSTPDRLPGAPIFGTAEPREGSRVAPRFERFGARTRGALVDSASRRGWLAPWPSGRGGRPAARAARETPSAGNPGGGRGTESLAHLFGGASAATRARSSAFEQREGPWRGPEAHGGQGVPGPAMVPKTLRTRRRSKVSKSTVPGDPPEAAATSIRSACERANRERRVPSAAPEKALRAGEETAGRQRPR